MRRRKKCKRMMIAVLALILGICWNSSHSLAADGKYPERAIQVIFGYDPGSTDMGVRPFTEKLAEYLGQAIAYVYKPGAAGAIGASFVSKAKPDGYTLLGTSQTPIVFSPITQEGSDYSLKDFVPVCRLSSSALVLAVRADSPWKTLKQIVDEARKNPGKFTYSSAAVLGSNHIVMETFVKMANISMTHVPCKGSAPAVSALLGGHVNMTSSTMAPIAPQFKAGTLRAIGVFDKGRLKEYPNVPTFTELGYPVVHVVWYGLLAPKGTPAAMVRTIAAGLKKVIDNDRKYLDDRLGKMSLKVDFLMPEEFAKDVREYNEEMKIVVKELMKSTK